MAEDENIEPKGANPSYWNPTDPNNNGSPGEKPDWVAYTVIILTILLGLFMLLQNL